MAEYEPTGGEEPVAGAAKVNNDDAGADQHNMQDAAAINRAAEWCDKVRNAKAFWEKDFRRMADNAQMATYGAEETWVAGGKYIVPLTTRQINQKVAHLYARNPKAVAKLRPRLWFSAWDENPQTLEMAMQSYTQAMTARAAFEAQRATAGMGHNGGPPMGGDPTVDPMAMQAPPGPDPNVLAIIEEVAQAQAHMLMLKRIGKTLEYLFNYFTGEQEPNFKQSLKQLVRNVCTNSVGYIEIDYGRTMQPPAPEITAKLEDAKAQMAEIQRLMEKAGEDGDMHPDSPDVDKLRTMIADMQAQTEVILREGPVFDFPDSDEVIPDPATRYLKGFVGAQWVAREFLMYPDEVKRSFDCEMKAGNYTAYASGKASTASLSGAPEKCCLWRIYDKVAGQVFVVADGYKGYVKPPAAPEAPIEGFWRIFALTFNDISNKKRIFPPSDAEMMKSPQTDINRDREALRDHRYASRPRTVAAGFSEDDLKLAQEAPAHSTTMIKSLGIGEKVGDKVMAWPVSQLDPALYDDTPHMQDILRSTGTQEANIGPTSDGTATEASIAENSRSAGMSSEVDDLDEFLTIIARKTGQLMLQMMKPETVKRICGPGAVWPEMTRTEIMEEIGLEVRAGSSGRPNRAAELANMERAFPFLQILPNINPTPLATKYADLLDIDPEEMILEGLPSLSMLNSQMRAGVAGAGGPAPGTTDDPNGQGAEGADNAPRPVRTEGPNNAPQQVTDPTGPAVAQNMGRVIN
jgi:hypothetical protein